MMRSTVFAASTATAALLLTGLGAAPAFAAEWTPSTFPELQTALTTCADGDTVRLGADITAPQPPDDWEIVIGCDLTLDLNGFTLTGEGVMIAPDTVLTIAATGGGTLESHGRASLAGIAVPAGSGLVIDGGTIVATGDSELDFTDGVAAAGIGGGLAEPGSSVETGVGDITINGGTVTAVGGDQVLDSGAAAGIGAAFASQLDGGRVTINGGTVTATGGGGKGAGIGGTAAFEVAVAGGTVTATGGVGSAGIGGASDRPGAQVSLTGGTVTATGGVTAIGAGAGSTDFGSLAIGTGATLHVPSGPFVIPDSNPFSPEVFISEGARLLGTEADPTVGADLTGAGQIRNDGAIALDESHVGVEVQVNDHLVSFDPQTGDPAASVRLYAPDFSSGYREIPASPANTVWNTSPDGLGQVFTETTRVFDDLTLYAVDDAFWRFAVALAQCTDGDVIRLDFDLAGGSLVVGCDVTLDLNGFDLFTSDVQVAVDSLLVVEDTRGGGELSTPPLDPDDNASGVAGIGVPSGAGLVIRGGAVTVAGGRGGAGIGGGGFQDAGFIRIEGGTVTATGGLFGAGIGGGYEGAGGDVAVTGGTVTAIGGQLGAGIGGGESAGGGSLIVSGGAVTAIASEGGAGIGGGFSGSGAVVDIAGGTVTAIGSDVFDGSAVGAGPFGSEFGSLRIAGTLRVPEGVLSILDSDPGAAEVVIEAGGQLVGTEADPTSGATIDGDGQIDNHGVIALVEALVGVEVNDHDFLVTFDPQNGDLATSVRLFAPDFASGYRSIPAPPELDGWNTAADGSGAWFDATTPVTGDLTLFATTDATLVLTADDDTVAEGGSLTFRVSGTTHDGRPVDTSGVVLTSSVASDVVDGLTVTFPTASPHVITATLGDVSTSITVEVTPPAKPRPQPVPAGLSTTGTDLLPPLVAGVLLLLAGAGLAWRRRRPTP